MGEPPRTGIMKAIARGSAVSLLCVVSIALPAIGFAETIYKWRGDDGTVTYSQSPPAHVDPARVEKIDVETLSREQHRAALRLLRTEERKAEGPIRKLEAAWKRADANVKSALASLRKAEADLATGRIALPGERLGNVGGGTRLTQAYFDRLAALETKVDRAKQELDRAYEERGLLK